MFIKNNNSGFTILEALFGLLIFVGIVVPFLVYINGSKNAGKAKDVVIAESILEQEIEKAKFENQNPTEITRTINSVLWKVTFELSDNGAQVYKVKVFKNDKFIANAAFYKNNSVKKDAS